MWKGNAFQFLVKLEIISCNRFIFSSKIFGIGRPTWPNKKFPGGGVVWVIVVGTRDSFAFRSEKGKQQIPPDRLLDGRRGDFQEIGDRK